MLKIIRNFFSFNNNEIEINEDIDIDDIESYIEDKQLVYKGEYYKLTQNEIVVNDDDFNKRVPPKIKKIKKKSSSPQMIMNSCRIILSLCKLVSELIAKNPAILSRTCQIQDRIKNLTLDQARDDKENLKLLLLLRALILFSQKISGYNLSPIGYSKINDNLAVSVICFSWDDVRDKYYARVDEKDGTLYIHDEPNELIDIYLFELPFYAHIIQIAIPKQDQHQDDKM